jgi:Dipeptidyl aminopeptidases/acylaminoacyl-peptidases
MKQVITLFILILFVFGVQAQNTLSLKDAILGPTSYLKPNLPTQLLWRDAQHYLVVKDSALYQSERKKRVESKVLAVSELNKSLRSAGFRSINNIPRFTLIDQSKIWFQLQNQLVVFDLNTRQIAQTLSYPKEAANNDFCAANSTLAYTEKNNLYLVGNLGTQQITNDTEEHILNGTSVHRNEFGINKGTFWSPKGNKLAFYRMDETMVGNYPLVDYMTREAELVNIKYPMAGMTSHQVKLGVYDLASKQTVFMQTGEPLDHYLTNIAWSPDEKSIFIQELNREQNHMKLNQYNVSTGEFIKTVLEETDEKYVEPLNPIVFSKTDPDKFYFQSRKDGWNHVYLCSVEKGIVSQITKGEWEVTELAEFDAKEENMFFEATKESPIERHFYKINLRSGKIDKITNESGTHASLLSPDCQYILDRWTSTEIPGKIDLISIKDKTQQTLFGAENTLKDFDLGENTVFTIKADDGTTDLYCRMIKPNNFDPAKKYPVIVYVYGGPHAQLVNKTWKNDARWWQYYMASKGYISFTVDSRGSANRGKAFESAIHRNLGVAETADQMKGIEYLKTLPYVDANRIGVHGWSYGGFMTLNLKLKHPEVFKVAVAGGPVVDWSMYEVMYGERYMDTPQENPDGYEKANMLNYVDKLSGKLLIIHGTQDQTVVMQHSIKFLKKCVDLNKQVDFFVYPTHEHNVRGDDRLHLMEKISEYFLENL